MAACPVNIPMDLWQRPAALNARCDMTIRRHNANEPKEKFGRGLKLNRAWEVRIGLTDKPETMLTVMGAWGTRRITTTVRPTTGGPRRSQGRRRGW